MTKAIGIWLATPVESICSRLALRKARRNRCCGRLKKNEAASLFRSLGIIPGRLMIQHIDFSSCAGAAGLPVNRKTGFQNWRWSERESKTKTYPPARLTLKRLSPDTRQWVTLLGAIAIFCWFGNPRFISQKSPAPARYDRALATEPNNRVLAKYSLRLCVSALKSTPLKRK